MSSSSPSHPIDLGQREDDGKRPRMASEESPKTEHTAATMLSTEELNQVYVSPSVDKDLEFFREILETTMATFRERLAEMDVLIEAKDWSKLSKVCHTVKGSSAMLKLEAARKAALQAEMECKKVDFDEAVVAYAVTVLKTEMERVIQTDLSTFEPL
jgi:HPt (histidine-containing phosphotransfer) domain-containing protein